MHISHHSLYSVRVPFPEAASASEVSSVPCLPSTPRHKPHQPSYPCCLSPAQGISLDWHRHHMLFNSYAFHTRRNSLSNVPLKVLPTGFPKVRFVFPTPPSLHTKTTGPASIALKLQKLPLFLTTPWIYKLNAGQSG